MFPWKIGLNTSHVSVQVSGSIKAYKFHGGLNTSHVSVQEKRKRFYREHDTV